MVVHDDAGGVDTTTTTYRWMRIGVMDWSDWSDGCSRWRIAGDHGHAHGSRRSDSTNYLGANPGGILGAAQANPCCG